MTRVVVSVAPPYEVVIAPGARGAIGELLEGRRRVAVISQEAIADRYADGVTDSLDAAEVFLIGDGEAAKTLATVEDLCRRFARWGLLRGDAVVALGGGVVGDVAGFAAATYHHGIAVVQVPTTLLAQVDAAIGGKTGVNLPEGKNLVGAFHQPIGVVADPETLASLPDREYRSGLGEVAKYALMDDVIEDEFGIVDLLRMHGGEVLGRDPARVADLVASCVRIKATVVAADPYERTGRREALNYGHTLAHTLETGSHYLLTHGEAVAIGLMFAARLAEALERIGTDGVDRHQAVIAALGLPTRVPGDDGPTAAQLVSLMRRDKKARGGVSFMLPGRHGLERVDDPPDVAIERALRAVGVGG